MILRTALVASLAANVFALSNALTQGQVLGLLIEGLLRCQAQLRP